MPVTELYAFNLICENLLAALYGVALKKNKLISPNNLIFNMKFCRSAMGDIFIQRRKHSYSIGHLLQGDIRIVRENADKP